MKKLIKHLSSLSAANAGSPVASSEIIRLQKDLRDNDITAIPGEYVEFLHHFNAFAYDGSFLYGISPMQDFFLDILDENLITDHPEAENNIILGHSEYDFLVWNNPEARYQIIDKSDFSVLNTYTSCARALCHILKIDDDEYI